jgi:uncharacterized protein (TIGR00251 family)
VPAPGGVRFTVRLTPRGGRDAIDGVDAAGILGVRVSAPPVDGAANRSLIRLLAAELGVAPTSVRIVSGERGRRKVVEVVGRAATELVDRYPGLAI